MTRISNETEELAAVRRLAARFPELRRECPCLGALQSLKAGGRLPDPAPCFECQDNYDDHGDWCGTCHGTGWLPVTPEKVLYWLLGWLLGEGCPVYWVG